MTDRIKRTGTLSELANGKQSKPCPHCGGKTEVIRDKERRKPVTVCNACRISW